MSVADIGDKDKVFAERIKAWTGDSHQVIPLPWHISLGPQKIADFLDAREGKKVILDLANRLVEIIENEKENKTPILLISVGTGCRVIEEALSIIKGIDKIPNKFNHIMIAPDMSGSEFNSIGKYASLAAVVGLAGLAMTQTKGKGKIAAAALGAAGGYALMKKNRLGDELKVNEGDEEIQLAKINRHIFYNPTLHVSESIPLDLNKATYYRGQESLSEIASFSEESLLSPYSYKIWRGEQVKSKKEILDPLLR